RRWPTDRNEAFGAPTAAGTPGPVPVAASTPIGRVRAVPVPTRSGGRPAVQGQVGHTGVFGAADPVLGPGPVAVTQFQISELPGEGVGRKAGQPVAVGVSDGQLRPGVVPLGTHDQSYPLGPGRQIDHVSDLDESGPWRTCSLAS